MRIAITAESTIDLPKELLQEFDIRTIPFTIVMGEEAKLDGKFPVSELFEFTDKTGQLPRTSAVNEFQYEEFFGNILKEYDEIVHISLSSEISSACANAKSVAAKNPEKIHVIDSRSLSTGIALLAIAARDYANEGHSAKEIVEMVEKRVPHDQASFSLESVNYLYKGGRCSLLSMIGANVLRIKPEIYVRDGKMYPGKKYRGPMKKVVLDYVEDTLAEFNTPDLSRVFITYSTAPDEVVEAVEERLKKAGFQRIMRTTAGGTISCHCGPHCLGILYINDGK
jgi:DegV family protein with EDD domain